MCIRLLTNVCLNHISSKAAVGKDGLYICKVPTAFIHVIENHNSKHVLGRAGISTKQPVAYIPIYEGLKAHCGHS